MSLHKPIHTLSTCSPKGGVEPLYKDFSSRYQCVSHTRVATSETMKEMERMVMRVWLSNQIRKLKGKSISGFGIWVCPNTGQMVLLGSDFTFRIKGNQRYFHRQTE